MHVVVSALHSGCNTIRWHVCKIRLRVSYLLIVCCPDLKGENEGQIVKRVFSLSSGGGVNALALIYFTYCTLKTSLYPFVFKNYVI